MRTQPMRRWTVRGWFRWRGPPKKCRGATKATAIAAHAAAACQLPSEASVMPHPLYHSDPHQSCIHSSSIITFQKLSLILQAQ